MADTSPDYRDTVFLPRTDFPMKAGLAQKEPAILARWQQLGLYQRLRERRAGQPRFILHDGPPYANGDIHMGHAMNKVLKDIIVRSQSLLGKDAPYVPGWDCHGLPIEWKIEEEYRKKKRNKDEVPAAEFRAECRAYAAHWVGVQRAQFERLGVMGDWDDPYLTMAYPAEAAIVGELLKFAESGQLYRGAKPVMWSPVEKTALAEAEVEYEDIVSTQIDVGFEIVESPIAELVGAYAVIWTTTPWTIPVNQAIAYGPEVEYVLLRSADQGYLVAAELEDSFFQRVAAGLDSVALSVAWRGKGAALAGTFARHPIAKLFGHSGVEPGSRSLTDGDGSGAPGQAWGDEAGSRIDPGSPHAEFFARPRPFLPGDFVTTDAGTGLVHMAPDHGEDDFELCRANGIDPVFAVTDDGRYREDWAWLAGQGSVINPKFNAPDGPICADLAATGALLAASADYRHSYPHSWRSKAKVIFRCTPQWFIGMDRPLGSSSLASEASVAPSGEGLGGNGPTLRQLAVDAIERTRFVPEKGRNRIGAMVEGRPDWVISRQRAWGVPIALYVHRKSGDYLRDPAVNARIIQAFRAGGADAWFGADHQALLGPEYPLADYEPVNDILDVWFDSGSTHAFVVEARYGEGARADLYLEGSDQHRGWFQSSLLESCGTRGRAPYDAVLTHGFALDGQGRKMSKSLGNVVDPLKVIQDSGADILRLWVASTDYFEDVRIGKEVLATTSDAYRKLRNTFRYLLGALDGFEPAERTTEFPELERYVLHRLAELDAELRSAVEGFEFNRYVRRLSEFANDDLSAFFFDIRKDCLYCEAPSSAKRRAYRTVLDILFDALVRYLAPVLPFTTEEAWQTRWPDAADSVHFATWPEVDAGWRDAALGARWDALRALRGAVTEAIEPLRREKVIGSSLEAEVSVPNPPEGNLEELFIVAKVSPGDTIQVTRTDRQKCGRCWRHLPEVPADGGLCARCTEVVSD
jgi:isoleucyl-tRNA synthetase